MRSLIFVSRYVVVVMGRHKCWGGILLLAMAPNDEQRSSTYLNKDLKIFLSNFFQAKNYLFAYLPPVKVTNPKELIIFVIKIANVVSMALNCDKIRSVCY